MTVTSRSSAVFERAVLALYHAIERHRKGVLLGLLALTVIAAASLGFHRFRGDIDLMLPDEPEIRRDMTFLRETNLSGKVVFSVSLKDPGQGGHEELFAAVDRFAAALKPPMFSEVVTGFSPGSMMSGEFMGYVASVSTDNDLKDIDRMITPDGISARMRQIYLQSFKPESILMGSMSRSDPLGLRLQALRKFKALSDSMGYQLMIEGGHLVSLDGRHALVIAQTSIPMTDSIGSKRLVQYVEREIKALPPNVTVDAVGGHFHTVSNQRVIERDVKLTSLIASAAFLILFLGVFRDPRVGLVFAIPMIGVIYSINITGMLLGDLASVVIGFGTVIGGITIDYGIYSYIAAKKGLLDDRNTVKLARLIFIDAITTAASFGVLLLSRIEGYRQLAVFSMVCIAASVFLAMFILPHALRWRREGALYHSFLERHLERTFGSSRAMVALWLVATAVLLYCAFGVHVESNVAQLDGTEQYVKDAEARFHEAWGGTDSQAILVLSGKTYEDALRQSDRAYEMATASGIGNFVSFSMLWPSGEKRSANIGRWNAFWRGGREDRLKSLIKSEGARYGFSADAFGPFFDNLYPKSIDSGSIDELLGRLKERFVHQSGGQYQVLSFFPDDAESLRKVDAITKDQPGAFVLSRRALSRSISIFTSREAYLLVPLAIAANIILTALFFRNLKAALIALIPVAASTIWLLGIMAVMNVPVNIANIIASIVTAGIVVDFGIGITYQHHERLNLGTVLGISLSAVSTVIGTAVLLFARHPALFSMGLAMSISLLIGWLSSITLVPALCRMFLVVRTK